MHNDILRLPAVLATTGMSRSWLYAEVAGYRFPAPLKLGLRAIGWTHGDVQAWLDSRQRVL